MTTIEMTDMLDPRAPTWTRQPREPESITDTSRWFLELAAMEHDPEIAANYRRHASSLDQYLVLRGRLRDVAV